MKKTSIFLVLILVLLMVSGCSDESKKEAPYISLGLTTEQVSANFQKVTNTPLSIKIDSKTNKFEGRINDYLMVSGEINSKDNTLRSLNITGTFAENDIPKSEVFLDSCLCFIKMFDPSLKPIDAISVIEKSMKQKPYSQNNRNYVFNSTSKTVQLSIQPQK